MTIDLSGLTFDELVSLNNLTSSMIRDHQDGYLYICEVRSYGRVWVEKHIKNSHVLQDLCYEYYGEDGIVDVYTTNPNLAIDNYGDVMLIKSEEDFKTWKEYEGLKNLIPKIEKEIERWNNRDNLSFYERPQFEPYYSSEELNELKQKLKDFDLSFTPPQRLKKSYED